MPIACRPLHLLALASALPLLQGCADPYYGYGAPSGGYYSEPAPAYYYREPGPSIILEERFRDDRFREERLREERRREEERRGEEDRRRREDRGPPPSRVENRPQNVAPARPPQPQARQNEPHSASECGQRYGAADCRR